MDATLPARPQTEEPGSTHHGARIAPLGNVANFGIEGDRTQFVLWRAQNGELDGTNARVVVLMIGTNNLATATPENVARGIGAIVETVREKLPDTVVVLNALLPRGKPDDPARAKAAAVNALIAPLADGAHVRWLDASAAFLNRDGTTTAWNKDKTKVLHSHGPPPRAGSLSLSPARHGTPCSIRTATYGSTTWTRWSTESGNTSNRPAAGRYSPYRNSRKAKTCGGSSRFRTWKESFWASP